MRADLFLLCGRTARAGVRAAGVTAPLAIVDWPSHVHVVFCITVYGAIFNVLIYMCCVPELQLEGEP